MHTTTRSLGTGCRTWMLHSWMARGTPAGHPVTTPTYPNVSRLAHRRLSPPLTPLPPPPGLECLRAGCGDTDAACRGMVGHRTQGILGAAVTLTRKACGAW